MTLSPWPDNVDAMATRDTSGEGESGDSKPKGLYIGARLQELAHVLGLNQRQLALRLKQDPKHFNAWWHNKRRAAFITIVEMAEAGGRSIAWLCGEEAARPLIGTVGAHGHLDMTSKDFEAGTIHFTEAAGQFPAGTKLMVDPTSVFVVGEYLIVQAGDAGVPWIVWAFQAGEMDMMLRLDGEELRYQPGRHKVIGLITGMVVRPPKPLSA